MGAHFIWVSEAIRFCILLVNDLLGCADRVAGLWQRGAVGVSRRPGALGYPHRAFCGVPITRADISMQPPKRFFPSSLRAASTTKSPKVDNVRLNFEIGSLNTFLSSGKIHP